MEVRFWCDISHVPHPHRNDNIQQGTPRTPVEAADGNVLQVDGIRALEVDLDQPGTTTMLGLFPATSVRRIPSQVVALGTRIVGAGSARLGAGAVLAMAAKARNIVEVHRMLSHPNEDKTRKTAEAIGMATMGQWGSCEAYLQVKAKRHTVPRMTGERANLKGQRFFVDVSRSIKHSSLGGNNYAIIFVNDYTCFKMAKFVKKNNTTAALLFLIADYITSQELSIKYICMDNSGEFKGEFQRKLDRSSITHDCIPPDTPQYNGVAERALGLLREKAIALMEELDNVINVLQEELWAQAMLFTCDVTNTSATTSTEGGKSPSELWFGTAPTSNHLRPFGAEGYA